MTTVPWWWAAGCCSEVKWGSHCSSSGWKVESPRRSLAETCREATRSKPRAAPEGFLHFSTTSWIWSGGSGTRFWPEKENRHRYKMNNILQKNYIYTFFPKWPRPSWLFGFIPWFFFFFFFLNDVNKNMHEKARPPVFASGRVRPPARPARVAPNTASSETSVEAPPVGSWNKWFEVFWLSLVFHSPSESLARSPLSLQSKSHICVKHKRMRAIHLFLLQKCNTLLFILLDDELLWFLKLQKMQKITEKWSELWALDISWTLCCLFRVGSS